MTARIVRLFFISIRTYQAEVSCRSFREFLLGKKLPAPDCRPPSSRDSRRSLQNANPVERVLNIHVLAFDNVLNVERQIRFKRFLIVVYGGLFSALAYCDDGRFIRAR